jgi:hypothetical protein
MLGEMDFFIKINLEMKNSFKPQSRHRAVEARATSASRPGPFLTADPGVRFYRQPGKCMFPVV